MRTTRLLKAIIICFIFCITTSGVYRHDVPIEEYLALANREEFDCVGQIYSSADGKWRFGGSCVLIDSLHILTAAHCVTGEYKRDTVLDYQGYRIETYIVTGRYLRSPGDFWFQVYNQNLKAKRIICHPDYLKGNGQDFDMAIIELDRPVRNAGTIFLNKDPDELNDTVTGVGFGGSGPAISKLPENLYSIKLAGQNIIDSAGGAIINKLPSKLCVDFDHPDAGKEVNRTGSKFPLPLEYGVKGGDSGGPLFRKKNNRLELLGILSGSDGSFPKDFDHTGYYGQIDSWSRIAAFYNWIQENK